MGALLAFSQALLLPHNRSHYAEACGTALGDAAFLLMRAATPARNGLSFSKFALCTT